MEETCFEDWKTQTTNFLTKHHPQGKYSKAEARFQETAGLANKPRMSHSG